MTTGQHFDYEALAQDALRGVVRAVLIKVRATGLVGDHHFYIAFNTQAPGVNISKRLREKYPLEMTIVLQHRFWDLEVSEERFEVKLTFDGIPERLVVPFQAVKVFYDPSVPYGLQFEESELMASSSQAPGMRRRDDSLPGSGRGAMDAVGTAAPGEMAGLDRVDQGPGIRPLGDRADKRRAPRRPRTEKTDASSAAENKSAGAAPAFDVPRIKPAAISKQTAEAPAATRSAIGEVTTVEEPVKSGPDNSKVVDFSKFRKK